MWVFALKDIMAYRGRPTFAQKFYSNAVSATIRDTEEKQLFFSWVFREVAQKRCCFIWLLKVEWEFIRARREGR